jgi:hypothetical protein
MNGFLKAAGNYLLKCDKCCQPHRPMESLKYDN